MSSKRLFILFTIPLLFLAAGCAPECTMEEYSTFFPIITSPADGAILDHASQPVLDWTHEESCVPEYYAVHIAREDGASGVTSVPGDQTKYTMENSLLPGLSYEWYVEPHGAFTGDGSGEVNVQYITGNRSPIYSFTASGRCSPSELEPPVLTKPEDGKWIGDVFGYGYTNVSIRWEYPGDCYPEYFHYQLAADPGFTNIITSGITDWDDHSQWVSVPECARVYWRVEARTGNSSGGYSEPNRFTFMLDGTCWQNQQSIDASLIQGFVFEDICGSTVPYVPENVGISPPCIFGEPFGVHADGIRARSEQGIGDILVDLGAGPCPSTGLDQFETQQNGMYYFMVQSPGQYCVSIDKANNPDLDHGIWTLPLTDQDIAQVTLDFNQGDDRILQNFGWDENDFLQIEFLVDLLSFCRAGDSSEHTAVAEVPAGIMIPIFARNEDATWFATIVDGKRCFISIASGKPEEDPNDLMIFPRQPGPVIVEEITAPKVCSDYKTEDACMNHNCQWIWGRTGGYCTK